MEDTLYARSYFAFEAALADMQASNALRSSTTYTLPIVVHIMHDGDAVGTGSNLSESQINSAIDALNADFQGAFGGADIDIEFVLAARDPDGNPTSGILRTDVSATIPSFTSTGMVTSTNLDPASEMNVKNLSHWPGQDYINVWVLHKLNGGTSPLGFAYLPPTSGTHDGIVVHHQVFGVGDQYNLLNNFDQNRTLTHEMGHYFGLLHTFANTSNCNSETNCSAQGDKVCDTPPTTGSTGCSAMDCPDTMVENFMDYSNDNCMEAFTEGQRTRMRNSLEGYRTSLLTSDGAIPVSDNDAGISSVEGILGSGCASTIQPEVLLQNFGSLPLTAATVSFSLDGGPVNHVEWTGSIAAGDHTMIELPLLSAGAGEHELVTWSTAPGDGYAPNDTLTTTFDVMMGSFLEMEIQFDALPFGISWSVSSTDDGTVIMEGGNYSNSAYSGGFISASECAVTGCYELVVEDIFGNGLHYQPPGWYSLTDSDGNVLGSGSGNFGAEQVHAFCIDGSEVPPCPDANANGICDSVEEPGTTDVPGCTDPTSCTYDAAANLDDGSCAYLDAVGICGGDCPGDDDGDGICNTAEIPGCMDASACNFDPAATDDAGNCSYPPTNYDCDGNVTVVVEGCTDPTSCTYSMDANTDDGSCAYLDALGICGGDCPGDDDGDGICNTLEIAGCLDAEACNYDATATDDAGNCTYPPVNFDCNGNITVVVEGCLDPESCTFTAGANTDDGSCLYLDALGICGGDCPGDADGDSICDDEEIAGCTALLACNYDPSATDDDGGCVYPPLGFDCGGNPIVVVEGCTDPSSCTYDASANTEDGSCQYLDAIGTCGGDCPGDADGDLVCDNAEVPGCMDATACNFDASATDDAGNCTYPPTNYDCDGNITVVVNGCLDPTSCTYDSTANTDDGSCEYLDALGECGGDCPADADGDGVCDTAEIPGCTDPGACNYSAEATEEDGGCEYAAPGLDCEGNPLVEIYGCTDSSSCTYDADANTDDGSCEYLDALGECGGDCTADLDGDGVCDDAEIPGCTDASACNFNPEATDEDGGCEYAAEGFDCDGNPLTSGIGTLTGMNTLLACYPNPTSTDGAIRLDGLEGQGPWRVQWFSAAGQLASESMESAIPGHQGWGIMMPTPVHPGAYIIKVSASGHRGVPMGTGRVLVQ